MTKVEEFATRTARDERFSALRHNGTKHLIRSTTSRLTAKQDSKGRFLGEVVYLLSYPEN